jgi:hypothetical protein
MATQSRAEHEDSPALVLIVGLFILTVGMSTVFAAVGLGSIAAAALGVAFLTAARLMPTAISARSLRVIVAGLGIVALAGTVFDLLT